jgi:hypothetical protein
MKSFADGLLPYYGEDCVVRLFHRRWQFREQGVTEFVQRMPDVFKQAGEGILTLNSAVLNVLIELHKDKV